MTERYLSITEVAALLGVKSTSMQRYELPKADALIGRTRGWKKETIVAWMSARPGQGYRTDLHPPEH